ncbi:hypothetical protein [Labrys neptuniae]
MSVNAVVKEMQTINKKIFAFGSMMLAGLMLSTSALADGTVTVVNRNSGRSIQEVFFANAGENDPWQSADLESPVAPQSSKILSMSGSNCFFDIKVRFSDGYETTFPNVNVCHNDSVLAD